MIAWVIAMLLVGGAANPPQVDKFLREPVGLYDESGVLIEKRSRASLPKKAPIVGEKSAAGHLGILVDGKKVFVRSSEVLTSGLADNCAPAGQSARSSSRTIAASDVGVSSGMSSRSVPCVR